MYTLQRQCRACGYGQIGPDYIKNAQPDERLIQVFDLGLQPLANDFKKDDEPRSGYAPLSVLFCPNCTLGQLSVNVDPNILYDQYSYVTSTSDMMKRHFNALADEIEKNITRGPDKSATILEIGSNDGRLLKFMKDERGFSNVYGIDPAFNLADAATNDGIETMNALFTEANAKVWCTRHGFADIILARHVFCHVDNWKDFIRGLQAVIHTNSLIGIEIPYAKKMLEHTEFDTVYHEHLSYMTMKAIQALLNGTSLHVHNVTQYPIHGGTIVLWLRRDDYQYDPDPVVETMIANENITVQTWNNFSMASNTAINELRAQVMCLNNQGFKICGMGASAKSTVWMNACQFTRKQIRFITDNTVWKQWRTSPGTDIPIVDEGALLREQPDYAILFAWNYAEEIISKNEAYLRGGGKFIIPIPHIRIVDHAKTA